MPQRPNNFTINRNHPLAKGLVFAGLGAHSGSTRYHDSSVYGNHGVLTNMEPATDWVYGNELSRKAVLLSTTGSKFVSCPTSVTVMPITMSCWARARNVTENHTLLGLFADDSSRYGWYLSLAGGADGDYCNAIQKISAFGIATSTLSFSAENWIHVCGVFTSTTSRVCYANGVPGSVNTTSIAQGTVTNTWIGKYRDNLTYAYSNCDVADPMVWKRALTLPEIQQLADPSNVMLSGLINYPRRKWWPVVSGAAPSFKSYWANQATQVAM